MNLFRLALLSIVVNFAYQVANNADYDAALERSYFMCLAYLLAYLFCREQSAKEPKP